MFNVYSLFHIYLTLSPQRGLKNTQRLIALRLKKVCQKVSLCENCQRQSCKAFIGLTVHAKMIGGGWRHLLPEIFMQTGHNGAKSPIFDLFSLVASSDSAVTPSERV